MIPQPAKITVRPGHFNLTSEMAARWKQDGLRAIAALQIMDDSELGPEGYELAISPEAVRISAPTPTGHFYAGQTLRQLVDEEGKISCGVIRDWPRFSWRGMHLDVVRHFFPVEFVKRYLDILALHKLNVFHWHLTDDQGWRIEIQSFPRLTAIGAWRVDREHLPWDARAPQTSGETASYGGYYTREQIEEVVAYARERGIEIVPEIEMPAHVLAALAAYPGLSCTGGPFTVAPGQYWPDRDLLCAGNEATFDFLEHVLTEVAEMFPGRYVHIGGDEADTREWERCLQCRQRMNEEGLASVSELQGYFTQRVGQILRKLNKRLVGWDEILGSDLDPNAVVMSWRGIEGGVAAAKRGHDVVMTPSSHLYFDHYQSNPQTEPKAFSGHSPLSKVYSFEPIPTELSSAEARHVLGAQANLWTEFVSTPEHAEYMVLPRIAALAELAWSPRAAREWSGFELRLSRLLRLYAELGFHSSAHCQ